MTNNLIIEDIYSDIEKMKLSGEDIAFKKSEIS